MDSQKSIWLNGEMVPWQDATVHSMAHSLHYGSGAFEGIRFYETAKGPAIFKLKEHIDRLWFSSETMGMKIPFTKEQIMDACKLVVKENNLTSGYIRPLVMFTTGNMGLNPKGAKIEVLVAAWPWGKYLGDKAIRVQISKFVRIHPKSTVVEAKLSGHYVNSTLAGVTAKNAGFDEALLLDHEGNVAEGPGENLFIFKNGNLITPALGSILPGITRATLMTLAKDKGITVTEEKLKPADVLNADEAFFTGTAAEVTIIDSFDDHKVKGSEKSTMLRTLYGDVVRGKVEKYTNWLTFV